MARRIGDIALVAATGVGIYALVKRLQNATPQIPTPSLLPSGLPPGGPIMVVPPPATFTTTNPNGSTTTTTGTPTYVGPEPTTLTNPGGPPPSSNNVPPVFVPLPTGVATPVCGVTPSAEQLTFANLAGWSYTPGAGFHGADGAYFGCDLSTNGNYQSYVAWNKAIANGQDPRTLGINEPVPGYARMTIKPTPTTTGGGSYFFTGGETIDKTSNEYVLGQPDGSVIHTGVYLPGFGPGHGGIIWDTSTNSYAMDTKSGAVGDVMYGDNGIVGFGASPPNQPNPQGGNLHIDQQTVNAGVQLWNETSKVLNAFSKLNPGAARDNARAARCNLYLSGALQGDIKSAQSLLYGQSVVYAQKEKDLYNSAIARADQMVPSVMKAARALGTSGAVFTDIPDNGWQDMLKSAAADINGRLSYLLPGPNSTSTVNVAYIIGGAAIVALLLSSRKRA